MIQRSASEIRNVFVDNLRLLCAREESVSEVARQVGVNRSQFNRYCNGETSPRPEVLDRICAYFGVDARILLQPLSEFEETSLGKFDGDYEYLRTFIYEGVQEDGFIEDGIHLFWRRSFVKDDKYFANLIMFKRQGVSVVLKVSRVKNSMIRSIQAHASVDVTMESVPREIGLLHFTKSGAVFTTMLEGTPARSYGYIDAFSRPFTTLHYGYHVLARPTQPELSRSSRMVFVKRPQTTKAIFSAARRWCGYVDPETAPPEIREALGSGDQFGHDL